MQHLYFDLIGYISIFFAVHSFLSKTTYKMRVNGMLSTLFFAISLFPYGGLNGIVVSLISFFSKLLTIVFPEEKLFLLKIISPFIAIIYYYFFNTEGIYGLLPTISLLFVIFADIQKDLLKMKKIYILVAFIWLIYGFYLIAIPSIIYDIVSICFLSYFILKNKRKKDKILI